MQTDSREEQPLNACSPIERSLLPDSKTSFLIDRHSSKQRKKIDSTADEMKQDSPDPDDDETTSSDARAAAPEEAGGPICRTLDRDPRVTIESSGQ
jgi:hypothetical protein